MGSLPVHYSIVLPKDIKITESFNLLEVWLKQSFFLHIFSGEGEGGVVAHGSARDLKI
jgi:hypothetical protein